LKSIPFTDGRNWMQNVIFPTHNPKNVDGNYLLFLF